MSGLGWKASLAELPWCLQPARASGEETGLSSSWEQREWLLQCSVSVLSTEALVSKPRQTAIPWLWFLEHDAVWEQGEAVSQGAVRLVRSGEQCWWLWVAFPTQNMCCSGTFQARYDSEQFLTPGAFLSHELPILLENPLLLTVGTKELLLVSLLVLLFFRAGWLPAADLGVARGWGNRGAREETYPAGIHTMLLRK